MLPAGPTSRPRSKPARKPQILRPRRVEWQTWLTTARHSLPGGAPAPPGWRFPTQRTCPHSRSDPRDKPDRFDIHAAWFRVSWRSAVPGSSILVLGGPARADSIPAPGSLIQRAPGAGTKPPGRGRIWVVDVQLACDCLAP